MKIVDGGEGFTCFEHMFAKYCTGTSARVYFLFTGSIDPVTGVNWCPDCAAAEPVVEKAAEAFEGCEDTVLIRVSVGSRESWKDQSCPFRTDSRIRLTRIPTMLRISSGSNHRRLTETQLTNPDLLEMMFSE